MRFFSFCGSRRCVWTCGEGSPQVPPFPQNIQEMDQGGKGHHVVSTAPLRPPNPGL